MPLPADYLAAGPLIVDRLRHEVRELRQVQPLEDVSRLPESAVASPFAYVLYDGDEVLEAEGRARQGASQLVRQRWMVVLAVRNAAQVAADRVVTDGAAGPLLSKIIAALAGWTVAPFRSGLYRVSAPRVSYGANIALYPLLFAGELVTS